MELKKLPYDLTVCKVADIAEIDLRTEFYFIGKTDEEISLVCKTEDTPETTTERDDGWRGFRIQGVLDFSLIGIITLLSQNEIAVSLSPLPSLPIITAQGAEKSASSILILSLHSAAP